MRLKYLTVSAEFHKPDALPMAEEIAADEVIASDDGFQEPPQAFAAAAPPPEKTEAIDPATITAIVMLVKAGIEAAKLLRDLFGRRALSLLVAVACLGMTACKAAADGPPAKPIAATGPAVLTGKPVTLPLKPVEPARCPNCTVCDKCQCFGGGYHCADGKCPIKLKADERPCECGAAEPPGYKAIYERVLRGERLAFEVRSKVGDWDKGVYECWLERGEPVCRLRTVVPAAPPRPVLSSCPTCPASRFGPPSFCMPVGR